ncbi:sulfatase family protein [Crateriforma conspicua]|uniref:Arylsulfatase n=1 Tax=Crateriforma conspicua TaxID=2527996 RepID=A0A5C5YCU8_9PLAN|nr:arylsulfatase [Crateriforma conspicua]TWT72175.1 Arylsulfatase [Crateriforma conspicua]
MRPSASLDNNIVPTALHRHIRFCQGVVSLVCCLVVLGLGGPQASAQSADPPNVIVIMADDLGYGDVSCYGHAALETPHIDQLAAEGLRFTSGYCSASTCTPTRYSFLTGTYAFREDGTGIAPPNSPALIPAGTTTIASLLKSAGYHTAVIGKWHLGLGTKDAGPDWNGKLSPGPLEIGFDHCFLLPTTNDRVPQVYVQDHHVLNLDPADPLWVGQKKPSPDHPTGISHRDTLKMDWSHGHNSTIHNGISRIGFYTGGNAARFRDEDLSDRWVSESKQWIKDHQSEPFFLFFASHDLHVPRAVHERFQGSSGLGPRGDAIVELDWCVGELISTLKDLQLDQKTMVVFCSDNGPVLDDGYKDDAIEKLGDHDPNGPFTGGKYNVYEGGTRTPLITWWPGTIRPGVSDKIVCTVDLAASCAAMAGVPLPDDGCLDSFDVSDALLGADDAQGRQSLVQQDNGKGDNYGYRVGDWKLVRADSKKANNMHLRLVRDPIPQFQLFNLADDPGETNNVIDQHPDVAQRMKAELAELIAAGRSRP